MTLLHGVLIPFIIFDSAWRWRADKHAPPIPMEGLKFVRVTLGYTVTSSVAILEESEKLWSQATNRCDNYGSPRGQGQTAAGPKGMATAQTCKINTHTSSGAREADQHLQPLFTFSLTLQRGSCNSLNREWTAWLSVSILFPQFHHDIATCLKKPSTRIALKQAKLYSVRSTAQSCLCGSLLYPEDGGNMFFLEHSYLSTLRHMWS